MRRLFFYEQIPLLFAYSQQLFFVLWVFYLDVGRWSSTFSYAVWFSLCILFFYFIYRYCTHRRFYRRLSLPLKDLDHSLQDLGNASLPSALSRLLGEQSRFYQEELLAHQDRKKKHLIFIHQWVHQMKIPLSVLHLIAQEGDVESHLDSVREEVDRLKRGLEMVLYTSRLDAFAHDFHVHPVQLQKLLSTLVSENKYLFIRNRVFPKLEVPEDLWIESDVKWISFVFTQLLTNAVRYSVGDNKKIRFTASMRGQRVVVAVEDEGVGIPREDIDHVFQPYYTGVNGRRYRESTGMGLYLVHEVCERLGYQVELESQRDKGTKVSIVFGERIQGDFFSRAKLGNLRRI
ncbi:sensor histidine kinase [Pasteuria penetrans]|uniref:sensor histidine kinase n=1 Tax=Pasteuria penetrans TaxID=86005 RepID=UPI000FB579F6|nr:sensor histidine kinase [Pasteuria penetrans]